MRNIAILGSTGSIGRQTLDVIRNTGCANVYALAAAGNNMELFNAQKAEFNPLKTAINDVGAINEIVSSNECDLVLNALSGSAGLRPAIAALKAKKTLALANKETLVSAGAYMAEFKDAKVLPVDSEHSAIFQCLRGSNGGELEKIYLTASGGPFRLKTKAELANVTPKDALCHPNWSMGKKITVDCATMMNKGLEMIEARWLFDLRPENIEIIVHPQSVIHSMVQFKDGAIIAQMGVPDMRTAIQYALTYPKRVKNSYPRLNFFAENGGLTFEKPRYEDFPCLGIAFNALKEGGELPCVMSAADEVAVEMFLGGAIGFNDIPKLIDWTMNAYISKVGAGDGKCLEKIFEAESFAKKYAPLWGGN